MMSNSIAFALFLNMVTNVQADISTANNVMSISSKNATFIKKRDKQNIPVTENLLKDIELSANTISELNQSIRNKISENVSLALNEIINIQTQLADAMKYSDAFFSALSEEAGFKNIENINQTRFLVVTTLAESLSVMEALRYQVQKNVSQGYALVINENRMDDAIHSPIKRGKSGMSREQMRQFIISHAS